MQLQIRTGSKQTVVCGATSEWMRKDVIQCVWLHSIIQSSAIHRDIQEKKCSGSDKKWNGHWRPTNCGRKMCNKKGEEEINALK